MNINTNYLVSGFSTVRSQFEGSKKNTLSFFNKLKTAKNTEENKINNSKNNELNKINHSRKNLPILMIENYSSGVSAQDRFANNTLKITRNYPLSLEPHHDLSQLLAQPLREFQSSPAEAYKKWIVTPAIPRSGSKISPILLRPTPLLPTCVQKRPTTTHQHASVISELNVVLAKRNAANSIESQVANAPVPQRKQPHATLSRAQSLPTATHQPISLMSELNAVLAKRNAANTSGHQSKNPLTLTPQQIKAPAVYVKEFNEIF